MSSPLLRTVDLKKSYFRGQEVPVLRGVNLSVSAGEFVSIVGTSGSGKSTLMHLIGGLDVPGSGEIYWKDKLIDPRNRRFRDRFRNEMVGYVFQFYHLLPELSALENVMLPALIRLSFWGYRREKAKIKARAAELLAQVGLSHRAEHRPGEMSGGEMQRAAIARALMSAPELLLADEPTGNLDFETGRSVAKLLFELSRKNNLAVLLVTHDLSLAREADRQLCLHEGRLTNTDAMPVRTAA
jgi:lipoprotein-releasing system ATP-binding protein